MKDHFHTMSEREGSRGQDPQTRVQLLHGPDSPGQSQHVTSSDILPRYPGYVDSHTRARSGFVDLLAVRLETPDSASMSTRNDLDLHTCSQPGAVERPGHDRTEALHREHPVNRHVDWPSGTRCCLAQHSPVQFVQEIVQPCSRNSADRYHRAAPETCWRKQIMHLLSRQRR